MAHYIVGLIGPDWLTLNTGLPAEVSGNGRRRDRLADAITSAYLAVVVGRRPAFPMHGSSGLAGDG